MIGQQLQQQRNNSNSATNNNNSNDITLSPINSFISPLDYSYPSSSHAASTNSFQQQSNQQQQQLKGMTLPSISELGLEVNKRNDMIYNYESLNQNTNIPKTVINNNSTVYASNATNKLVEVKQTNLITLSPKDNQSSDSTEAKSNKSLNSNQQQEKEVIINNNKHFSLTLDEIKSKTKKELKEILEKYGKDNPKLVSDINKFLTHNLAANEEKVKDWDTLETIFEEALKRRDYWFEASGIFSIDIMGKTGMQCYKFLRKWQEENPNVDIKTRRKGSQSKEIYNEILYHAGIVAQPKSIDETENRGDPNFNAISKNGKDCVAKVWRDRGNTNSSTKNDQSTTVSGTTNAVSTTRVDHTSLYSTPSIVTAKGNNSNPIVNPFTSSPPQFCNPFAAVANLSRLIHPFSHSPPTVHSSVGNNISSVNNNTKQNVIGKHGLSDDESCEDSKKRKIHENSFEQKIVSKIVLPPNSTFVGTPMIQFIDKETIQISGIQILCKAPQSLNASLTDATAQIVKDECLEITLPLVRPSN
ncbi:hypothetical protein ABK040_015168 [Willaertia magna]